MTHLFAAILVSFASAMAVALSGAGVLATVGMYVCAGTAYLLLAIIWEIVFIGVEGQHDD